MFKKCVVFILAGLGYCLAYVPSAVLCGLYYCKHRSLATGIATAGSGLGATLFPIIFHHIIERYGWRGSLFIVAGLNLHLFVFAALLWPVPDKLKTYIAEKEKIEIGAKTSPDDKLKDSSSNLKQDQINEVWTVEAQSKTITLYVGSDVMCNNVDSSYIENAKKEEQSIMGLFLKKLTKHFKPALDPDFLIFCISNIFWNAGIGMALAFLPEYGVSIGLDEGQASLIITLLGIGSMIGSVVGGLLGNVRSIDTITVYIFGNLGMGIAIIIVVWEPVKEQFGGLLFAASLVGFMFGLILGLLVIVTSDLLGLDVLGAGFGYLMFANGIGIFVGPPLAGMYIYYSRFSQINLNKPDSTSHFGTSDMTFKSYINLTSSVG